jgi:ABC-type bacteriocin/lantibiotic exporter with double-glycine peptidase domain
MSRMGETNDDIIVILSFYLAAAYRLVPSINKIFVSYQQIKFGKPSIPKIMEYYTLKKVNKFIENQNLNDSIGFQNKIILKNISFSYQKDKEIIKNLNLEIFKNKIVGISGKSGSGKSTIVNLLTGLIKPSEGKIIIDEKNITDPMDLRIYQNFFSITSQDTYLVDGTIKDNIIFGSSEQNSPEKLKFAIKFAQLEAMINESSHGIETYIGSSIKQLSSGQKQRISIARSIYSDRSILIFDEATNALDQENEKIIINNLAKLKSKKTIIIISHNPDNLKICDSIFKFENKHLVDDSNK